MAHFLTHYLCKSHLISLPFHWKSWPGRCGPRAGKDVGDGDLTAGLIDPTRQAHARVLARESAVVCGQAWVQAAILALDPQA